jgi:hypothetical protein
MRRILSDRSDETDRAEWEEGAIDGESDSTVLLFGVVACCSGLLEAGQ